MKKVLVVGGAGYIGCVLVEELLAKGYSVRVLDRLFFGREAARGFQDRVELVVEDMREFDEQHVRDCGAVINIGGLSNDRIGRVKLDGADPQWNGPEAYWGKR